MSSQQIASNRENAEVYHGDSLCKQKSKELLEKISLPKGLLPLDDVVEVGFNEATGFVWLRQKKKKEHIFRRIGRKVAYDTEVTAFVEDRRMRGLTGVKSKELLIWVSLSDIYIDDPNSGKITFGTSSGLSRSFPVSAFEEEN
ncbi:TRNA-modifying protein like [Actinidia chinensis var. chinensis]|uniref:tRNA-modifying protein like n=1 Tax=Actinidia chinensis var. chinensis TaxID=1590841 RepID=A0A2R6PY65_ACTCC|nr:TRNA-modifying protein like [Actinidia chinensis var. chinensis]